MKKLLLLFFIPFVCFGQFIGNTSNIKVEEYYDDGKKIIEKTWLEKEQRKTLVEIVSENGSEWRYFINENDIEIGAHFYVVRDYGKYFKVDISVINNSSKRIDFIPSNINITVDESIKNKEKYNPISYSEYNRKVKKRQNRNSFLAAFAAGLSNATAGVTYSQSNSYYSNNNTSGYVLTNTTSYSPTLASLQYQQNAENLNNLNNSQIERMNYINEGYLKNHTIFPNTTLEGYILIPYHKRISNIDMILRLDDTEFDFSTEKWH